MLQMKIEWLKFGISKCFPTNWDDFKDVPGPKITKKKKKKSNFQLYFVNYASYQKNVLGVLKDH